MFHDLQEHPEEKDDDYLHFHVKQEFWTNDLMHNCLNIRYLQERITIPSVLAAHQHQGILCYQGSPEKHNMS